jgi:phage shock protein PspC (stress-responsive transcriptional regulator)
MDISAALVVYGLMGSKPLRLLQGIAGGILGPRTYSGGTSTAILGLALHFVIAFGAATVFFLASRVAPLLLNHAVVSGVLYGIAVYFFMNRVVVQLSAATKFPFSIKMMLIGVIIHIFCVGIPISLSIRRYAR